MQIIQWTDHNGRKSLSGKKPLAFLFRFRHDQSGNNTNEDRMTGDEESSQQWHELDQESVRKSLNDIIFHFPESIDGQMEALTQLTTIVQERVAHHAAQQINLHIQQSPTGRAAETRELVEEINGWLSGLRLALKDPASGTPCRLMLAPTPPKSESESWLQLEPLVPTVGKKPIRLPAVHPWLDLVAEPSRHKGTDRSPR